MSGGPPYYEPRPEVVLGIFAILFICLGIIAFIVKLIKLSRNTWESYLKLWDPLFNRFFDVQDAVCSLARKLPYKIYRRFSSNWTPSYKLSLCLDAMGLFLWLMALLVSGVVMVLAPLMIFAVPITIIRVAIMLVKAIF